MDLFVGCRFLIRLIMQMTPLGVLFAATEARRKRGPLSVVSSFPAKTEGFGFTGEPFGAFLESRLQFKLPKDFKKAGKEKNEDRVT